ncbi:helix-turn-helix transcriptional regulator [Actinomadura rupiterrae]|uniref:helix-turn-helix transcriptional regulator n=1 Tax=Actinomadura rupiterrae TaxID=559627 RepID=UPI0020A4C8F7|nr:helix-turn-helix domain-containing protein [Actinomadura rupiterrae]MCP2341015.1 transposase-like protein [Actinomadura rupiterrae]
MSIVTVDRQDVPGLLLGGWYTTEELAEILGVDPSTLRRWRTAQPVQGPPFVKMSDAVTRYSAIDVQDWLLSRRTDPREVIA